MSKRQITDDPQQNPNSKYPKLENVIIQGTPSTKIFPKILTNQNVIERIQPMPSTSKQALKEEQPKTVFKKSSNPNLLRSILGFSRNNVLIWCPLCRKLIDRKKGLTFHNCEHSFCKNCFFTLYAKTKDELYCPQNLCMEQLITSSIKIQLDNRRKEKYEKAPKNNWLCHICEIRNASTLKICKFCDTAKLVKFEYAELLALEESSSNLVKNFEEFECTICFDKFKPGEGVILRNCFHHYCKECLTSFVKLSEVTEIICPENGCDSPLQDREIRGILTPIDYENYLRKSLNIAENQSVTSYHCKTPNCNVWWDNEENVNLIKCQVCFKINCISCNAIHEGLNCKEFQESLLNSQDAISKKTIDMLNQLLESKTAIRCKCGIIIQRGEGCDWVVCTMCKTEICWATKGFRWGPNGKGDTSGGCKCMVGGKRCAPNCKNCH